MALCAEGRQNVTFSEFCCENEVNPAQMRSVLKSEFAASASLAVGASGEAGVDSCHIIDRCAAWPPNTPIEKYRDLLPDRWKPSQK